MDEYEKEIQKDKKFEEATIKRKNDETIIVITKEKYIFVITAEEVTFNGIYDGKEPPALQEGNVVFKLSPEGWTKANITVEITTKIKGYDLEYSMDGVKWKQYENPIVMTDNGTIYARLVDILGVTGESATKVIDKIDRTPPSATFSVEPESPSFFKDFQIIVNRKDKESGIAPDWTMFISESAVIGENTSNSSISGSDTADTIKGNFTVNTPTTLYCHAILHDKAGNSSEIVSEPIIIGDGNVSITTKVKGYKIDVKAEMPTGESEKVKSLSIDGIGSYNGNSYTFDVKGPGTYTVKAVMTNGRYLEKIVEVPYYEETDVFAYVNGNNIAHSDFFTLSNHYGDQPAYIQGMIGAGNSSGAGAFLSDFDVPYSKLNSKNINYSEIYAAGRFDSGANFGGCGAKMIVYYKDGTSGESTHAYKTVEGTQNFEIVLSLEEKEVNSIRFTIWR